MAYWQEWFNACAETGFTAVPEQAALGWPEVSGGWDAVRGRFLVATGAARRISDETALSKPLLPPGVENPVLARDTHGSGLLHAAFHTAHHMGQIVTIRQLLGAWPPPAGSYTW